MATTIKGETRFSLLRNILLIIGCCFTLLAGAQNRLSKKEFIADSLKIVKTKLYRPQFRLDNRLVFLGNQKLNITGLDAGVLLKNKLRIALGYYKISDRLNTLKKSVNNVDYEGQYDLHYGSLNVEFIYKNTRYFSLGMPLEFGFGYNTLDYISEADQLHIDKQSGYAAMAYFGVSGTFKPIRWIGLKGALGYKKTLFNQIKDLSSDGVFTSVGLSIDIWEIIKDVRMYKLKRRYHHSSNPVETAVDLITD